MILYPAGPYVVTKSFFSFEFSWLQQILVKSLKGLKYTCQCRLSMVFNKSPPVPFFCLFMS